MKKQKIRIALAQINTTVGDMTGNAEKIVSFAQKAARMGADIVSFPELAVTGYPPEDLLFKQQFVDDNIEKLKAIAGRIGDIVVVAGFADRKKKDIFNAAAVMYRGKVRGVYHKVFLPNYGVFDEKRYFSSGETFPVFGLGRGVFGINICEDIWHLEGPAGVQAYKGARLIVNINASPYHMGKGRLREGILRRQAKMNKVFISYTNLVGGQDELVFDGSSLIVDDKGKVLARAGAFTEELLVCDIDIPQSKKKPGVIFDVGGKKRPGISCAALTGPQDEVKEVYDALVLGLKDYLSKNGFKKVVLGLSGGVDSSLVASIAADSIGADNVIGVFMPSVFTSAESKEDAEVLAKNLNIAYKAIPIQDVFDRYLELLKAVFEGRRPDVTEENLQARIRGNIIMALSNKFGFLALNTGNKSEVSCGYCTLYGDMAGGFGLIKDVPKTLVYELCAYKNKKEGGDVIPKRVFEKAPSAELRPDQKDSDTLPEYGLLDKILKLYVEEDRSLGDITRAGVDKDVAGRVIRMVDSNEYKRRQSAPGIKITPKAFGRDRRMPITNKYA
ncbi:MAG TPA: NAD+ synthase [Candidatus Omnitrophica bacterium]|nr:NAD+ synthase [Candidatus Omnitrophota bacterium]